MNSGKSPSITRLTRARSTITEGARYIRVNKNDRTAFSS